MFSKLLAREDGVTAIEYALIASLIAVVILGALVTLSGSVNETFEKIAACVESPGNC